METNLNMHSMQLDANKQLTDSSIKTTSNLRVLKRCITVTTLTWPANIKVKNSQCVIMLISTTMQLMCTHKPVYTALYTHAQTCTIEYHSKLRENIAFSAEL